MVSHPLRILANSGLIECRRAGQFVYSKTNPKVLREYTKDRGLRPQEKKIKSPRFRSVCVPTQVVGTGGNFKYGSRTPSIKIWSARICVGASKSAAPPDVT